MKNLIKSSFLIPVIYFLVNFLGMGTKPSVLKLFNFTNEFSRSTYIFLVDSLFYVFMAHIIFVIVYFNLQKHKINDKWLIKLTYIQAGIILLFVVSSVLRMLRIDPVIIANENTLYTNSFGGIVSLSWVVSGMLINIFAVILYIKAFITLIKTDKS